MSWIADAHNEWHTVNGWDRCCPLDCYDPYLGEVDYDDDAVAESQELAMAGTAPGDPWNTDPEPPF